MDIPFNSTYGTIPRYTGGFEPNITYDGLTGQQPIQNTTQFTPNVPYADFQPDNVLLSGTTVYSPDGQPNYGQPITTTVGGYNQTTPNIEPWRGNLQPLTGLDGRGTGEWQQGPLQPLDTKLPGENGQVSGEHNQFQAYQQQARDLYMKNMQNQVGSFAGGATGAREAVEGGYNQAIGLYEPRQQTAGDDIAAQRQSIIGGGYNVNPLLTQYQGLGQQQTGRAGTSAFGSLGTPGGYNPATSPRAGMPPQYQGYNRPQAPGINPFVRGGAPGISQFGRQAGPQSTAFQRGQGPGISQFQMGQGPQSSAFQGGPQTGASAFQRGQGPEINQFQRGAGPEFTGASQEGFDFNFEKDPGYQFRMDEGLKAIGAAGSARGNRFSGAADKDRMKYAQGLASEEYGKAYGRQRQQFESDRAMGEREAGRQTGFDVNQYQFGTGQDFASQQAQQGRQQQAYQFGTGVDVGEQARTQALQSQQQQFAQGLGASEQGRVQGAQQQAFQFGTGTGQQALRDFQGQQQQAYQFGTGVDVGERARTDAAARQDYQFGTGQDFASQQQYQQALQDRYRYGTGQDFASQQAMQNAVQDRYRFGVGQDFAGSQAANQFAQNQYQFGQQYGLSANEQQNRQQLSTNLQNYNMMNQQQQQQYQRMQGLAGAGREDIGMLSGLYTGKGEASANAILGLAAESRLSAQQKASEKAGERDLWDRLMQGVEAFNPFG